jgi:hypothetical protein
VEPEVVVGGVFAGAAGLASSRRGHAVPGGLRW